MSEEKNNLSQLPEIIDVEFLPTLDDEDFQREKNGDANSARQEAYKTYEKTIIEEQKVESRSEEEKVEEPKANPYEKAHEQTRDTSYASFNTAQKQAFRQKKKKFGVSVASGIGLTLAILAGLPVAAFLGFFVVLGLGIAVLYCGMAFGMGVLGLGMAGFTAVAGMGPIAMLCFFGSLLAIGSGGLGFCLLALIFIWIKRLWLYVYRSIRRKPEREVA